MFLNAAQNDKEIENIKKKLTDKENRKRSSNIHLVNIPEKVTEKMGDKQCPKR